MEKGVERYASGGEGAQDLPATAAPARVPRLRKIAFKLLVIVSTLLILVAFNLVLLMIVVSWLPGPTYMKIIGDVEAADLVHRVHDSVLPVIVWTGLIGTVLQLHRPRRKQAPWLMALAIPVVFALVQLATGTYTLGGAAFLLVPFLLVTLFHPAVRELLRIRWRDGMMAGLAGVATAAWVPFAYRHMQLQRLAVPGDAHAQMEHWDRMAAFAILVVIWSVIAASDRPGWRLSAWVASLATAWYGVQSLLFPVASAASPVWAIVAVAWAVGFVVAAERRARSAPAALAGAATQPG